MCMCLLICCGLVCVLCIVLAITITLVYGPVAVSDPSTTVVYKVTSNRPNAVFECDLDADTTWSPCPVSYTGLALGVHNLNVRATTGADDVSATPVSMDWTIGG